MTTELEEEFFKVFGIEPKYQDACTVEDKYWQNEELANEYGTFDMYMNAKCGNQENCTTQCSCAYTKEIYPEITDHKLLEMICILNETACEVLSAENIGDLKNEILETCIKVYNTPILTSDGDEYENIAIHDNIQQLFKEE